MKTISRTIFAVLAMLAMTACAPMQPQGSAQSPQQIAAQLCPSVTIALMSLQSLEGLSAGDTAALDKISNIVTPVCATVAGGGLVAAMDLKTFASTYSPVLVSIVKSSSLATDQKNRILLDLAVAQIAITALPNPVALAQ